MSPEASQPPEELGSAADFNPNAITREEMLGLQNQAPAEDVPAVPSESEEEEEAPPIGHPNNEGFSPYEVRPEESQTFNPEEAAVRVPLTPEDIASKRGGEYPTQDQVDSINVARAIGKHLH